MRVVVFQEKKLRERKRESYKFINSYESIQHIYPSNTNKYVKDATRKKKNVGASEILKKDHW